MKTADPTEITVPVEVTTGVYYSVVTTEIVAFASSSDRIPWFQSASSASQLPWLAINHQARDDEEFLEHLYHEGVILGIPRRLRSDARAEQRLRELSRYFKGGQSVTEIIREDRGPLFS